MKSLASLLAGCTSAALPDLQVSGVAADSARVRPGMLFLATRGARHHGLDFLDQAVAAGAAAVAWEPPYQAPVNCPVPAIETPALGRQLSAIAGRWHDDPSAQMPVIGITGTDGKTSCAHFIAQALRADAPVGVIGTLGYGLAGQLQEASHTTPDALRVQELLADFRRQGAGAAAMEVSSHALDQARVEAVRFAVAVLTNLTRDHLDYHGSEQAYADAKRRLFSLPRLGAAVLNLDDAFGRELAADLQRREAPCTGYGLSPGARSALGRGQQGVWAERVVASPRGLAFDLLWQGERRGVEVPLYGRFNVSNCLAVAGSLLALGMAFDDVARRLARLTTVPGRMQRFGGGAGQPVAVVDYAHTPHALGQALQALREHVPGRLWCVFGCGGDRDRGKRPEMGAQAERWADRVVVTDDNPRSEAPEAIIAEVLAGCGDRARVEAHPGRAQAIAGVIARAAAGDLVLIAGKGHEDYQIIGSERLPFSDRVEVEAALARRQA